MFKHIPNLRGTSPWILFDFRSPFRFHPHQGGEWNRKGLVSDQGQRKKHGTSCVITITKRKQNNEAQNKTLHGCPPPDLYGLERACPRKE